MRRIFNVNLNKYSKRESNIELFRLFIMLIIVIYHLSMHSFGEIYPHSTFWDIVTNIFHIGVVCFILISGWFGINASIKGFVKLVTLCVFYSLLLYALAILFKIESFTINSFIEHITPILHEKWWFITTYIVLYVISPYYNILWCNLSNKEKYSLLVILGIIVFYLGWIGHSSTIFAGRDIVSFVFLYSIGRKLRETNLTYKYTKSFIVILLFIIGGYIIGMYIPLVGKLTRMCSFQYCSPGLILLSVCFFMIFVNLRIKQTPSINFLATSVFPIYLIHENEFTYPYMQMLVKIEYNPFITFCVILILGILIVLLCIIIDKLLNPIYSLISRYVGKYTTIIIEKLYARIF